MAATDPLTTIRNGVVANLGNITKDDGLANAKVIHIWEGGPETLKTLFFDAGAPGPYDVVITYGEPRSRGERVVQDVPLHYLMSYPITVTTVDKPAVGLLLCTASRMQYKVTYALRAAIRAFAQSAPAAPLAYTLILKEDAGTVKRVGGLKIWEASHVAIYETDYA